MKKLVIVVVLLVLIVVVAPFGVGKIAEARVNKGLDKLAAEAPYITIVERKWTGGWFRSEQEVTVELFGAWMQSIRDAAKTTARSNDRAEGDAARYIAVADTAPADEEPADAEPEAAPESAPSEPFPTSFKITVHNEILHGPILWTSGIGLAQVNSKVELSEEIRKMMIEAIGTDEPVRMKTRVGLFGGGTTTLFGEGRTVKIKGDKSEIGWDDFKLALSYSGNLDSVDMTGKQPRIEIRDASNGSHFVLRDITLEGESERLIGDLYDSDFEFRIAEFSGNGPDKKVMRLEDLHYIVDTDAKGDFIDVSGKFGSGKVTSADLEQYKIDLKEVHYDVSLRHIHAATVAKIASAFKAVYSEPMPIAAPEELEKKFVQPLKDNVGALLKYDPEIGIDRIGLVTPEGEAFIKGLIKFKGVTMEDFDKPMAVVPKLDAEFAVEVPVKMIEKIPNVGATAAGAAVDSGYMKREGEKLVCKITLRNSELIVNGKPVPVPGMGGPPQGMSGGEMSPETPPPPQE